MRRRRLSRRARPTPTSPFPLTAAAECRAEAVTIGKEARRTRGRERVGSEARGKPAVAPRTDLWTLYPQRQKRAGQCVFLFSFL